MTKQAMMAQKILNVIATNPRNFNMVAFIQGNRSTDLLPTMQPDEMCGTTLCVAGWAGHFDGWIIGDDGAWKPGIGWRAYSTVALEALDIPDDQGDDLFYTHEQAAIAVLKRMASGEPYSYDMMCEEDPSRIY